MTGDKSREVAVQIEKLKNMKNFTYALRQVFRLRGSNAIKLLSITLGLAVSGVLFSRVAFERSFDSFLPNADYIYQLNGKYVMEGNTKDVSKFFASMVPSYLADIAGFECGTRFRPNGTYKLAAADSITNIKKDAIEVEMITVDSAFFDVFNHQILYGDPHIDLAYEGSYFIGQKVAIALFGSPAMAIDKVVTVNGKWNGVIKGVFQDVPANSHLQFSALTGGNFRANWGGGDNFYSYFKINKNADIKDIEAQIPVVEKNYAGLQKLSEMGIKQAHYLTPIRQINIKQTATVCLILTLLSIVIIVVSAFNYVLLTLASLSSRYAEIGIHKASGASSKSIFSLIMLETAIYIVLGIGLAAFVVAACRSYIEPLVQSYDNLFTVSNLWALAAVVVVLFVLCGVIPASKFSKVSVSEIFRRYVEQRGLWRKVLLFSQFALSAFTLCFMIIISSQYIMALNQPLGYDSSNLATTPIDNSPIKNTTRDVIASMPGVVSACVSSGTPIDFRWSGTTPNDLATGEALMSASMMQIDEHFLDVYRIPIQQGGNIRDYGDTSYVVVNDLFAKKLPVADGSPVGYTFKGDFANLTVAGVVNNIQWGSLHNEPEPIMMMKFYFNVGNTLTVRFKELSQENLDRINKKLDEIYPTSDYELRIYSDQLRAQYETDGKFLGSIIAMCICLIIITFIGVIGYTATEIRRRRSEIALRKINGASSATIILMMLRSTTIVSIAACVVGVTAAGIVGNYFLQSFAVKISLDWWIFVLSAISIIGMVAVTIYVQSRRVALSNPSKFIKH